ncbi:SBBP repeat-containing protein [bacterium]|nr:SBBP repeat-containing protein [bacterium]
MKRCNSFFVLVFLLILNVVYPQGWAKQSGGGNWDSGKGIATDNSGNSLVIGRFSGTAIFGTGEANQTILVSSGGDDIFVAKYDPNGALVWAKKAGGTLWEYGYGIATDGSGNSLVTGYFGGTATFGAGEGNQTTLTSLGDREIFVAKYDPSGTLVWAKKAGGTLADEGYSIATDGSGNSLVTGCFYGTATFGTGEANQTILTSSGIHDIFVAKYDPNGALLWAKLAGGLSWDSGNGIVTDGSGNSFVVGYFCQTATFGAGETNQTVLTSSGSDDIFVAKYDPNGALVWAKQAGGTSDDDGYGIATDGSGNSLVTGYFREIVTFGVGEPNQTALTSSGGTDIFIAKYDPNGALMWARKAGGPSDDNGNGIAMDGSGNSFVTGYFQQTATFDGTTMVSSGSGDIFVAKYNQDGVLLIELVQFASKVDRFTVLPAYPNPFNPSTTITYGINRDSKVIIDIYDIAGQLITTLLNTEQSQGWHSVEWNGTNKQGEQVPAGIYLSKITTGNATKTTKLMLLK